MEGMIGEVRMFGGNFAPRSWALCDGQLLPISQNSALFSILGTIYGGDGRTTFALPDCRGRFVIGPGNGPGLSDYREGQKGGQENVILNTTQIPSHTHGAGNSKVKMLLSPGNSNNPNAKNIALAPSGVNVYNAAAPTLDMAANNVAVTVGNTGGNQDHTNMMPYQVVNYIICLFGVYPSRS